MYVCLSDRLSQSRTIRRPLDGMRCHLAWTLAYSKVTLYSTKAPVPPWEKEILGLEPPVKICIANCYLICTNWVMVTVDSLKELGNAPSNGAIADPVRLPLPPVNFENWSIFGEVMDKSLVSCFFD